MAKSEKRIPQPMRPSGRTGRIFGWMMARGNKPAYLWTVDQLKSIEPKSVLEIGFGTGHLLKRTIKQLKPARVVGRDPSELMVETARKRLKRFRKKTQLDIVRGDDTTLPDGPYDAVMALHSFQFWSDPETTLRNLRAMLAPGGRLILVLRRHRSKRAASKLPNPLSHSDDEISATIAAAEKAGLTLIGMEGISRNSQGLILACG